MITRPWSLVENVQRVHGQLSGKVRQIDVRATGKLAGSEILIVVECKRRKTPVGIGVIDEFIGKLLDVRADLGILFSFTGFTEPAIARADAASHPKVGLVILGEPEKEIDEFVPPSAVYAPEDATYDAMRQCRLAKLPDALDGSWVVSCGIRSCQLDASLGMNCV
ncbi:restriction endonuclease [Spirillospora sp. CA-128828]|uniref:restriction endonuclease n=1 Tax=Spirillospora sp. CA-128828 TaxID=3240033 RepID=UPI003D932EA0